MTDRGGGGGGVNLSDKDMMDGRSVMSISYWTYSCENIITRPDLF
jgi:hypothetical protein